MDFGTIRFEMGYVCDSNCFAIMMGTNLVTQIIEEDWWVKQVTEKKLNRSFAVTFYYLFSLDCLAFMALPLTYNKSAF